VSTTPKRHGTVWLILALIASVLAFAGCRAHEISSTARNASFDPTRMDAVEIMDSLKRRAVTARELVDIYSGRIAKFDKAGPKLNSIIAINPHARTQADVLDRERAAGKVRGPLHGLPIIVKDSYDVVGMPTTGGSVALANAYPGRNAAVVQRMVDAGAIVLAKANMSELAFATADRHGYSSVLGVTLNPYNLKRNSLDSSSGTASAIAAKFAAFGLGTDTSVDFFGGNAEVDATVKQAVHRMRELGTTVVQVRLPDWMSQLGDSLLMPLGDLEFKRDFEAYLATLPPGSPKTVADVIAISGSQGVRESAHPVDPQRIEGLRTADAVGAAPEAASNRERILRVEMPRVRQALTDTFTRLALDALVFPTLKCTASPAFTTDDRTYSCNSDHPGNSGNIAPATGFPTVTVPVGHDSQQLPIGLSFLGLPYGEQRILDLAASLEQASPMKRVPASVS
jgi:Asp-tRNA(Asn)/Glu-tRNA(Gln) amidotransferase A subunit family amidase